jgi:2-polyprenyl-6-methoxyphenol hydroxylase-like FAD-dependent oxidoreductase
LIYITIKSKQIVIVGAGIAGAGLAYRLAQRGIETVPISSEGGENTPTISRKSATSVINRRLMEDTAIATDNLHFDDETPGTQRYGSALRSPKIHRAIATHSLHSV